MGNGVTMKELKSDSGGAGAPSDKKIVTTGSNLSVYLNSRKLQHAGGDYYPLKWNCVNTQRLCLVLARLGVHSARNLLPIGIIVFGVI